MTRGEIAERIGFALTELEQIDLRGRRAGTLIHEVVTNAREELERAYEALAAEEAV